jgi:hypothetical protein
MSAFSMRVERGDDRYGGSLDNDPGHERHQRFMDVKHVEGSRPEEPSDLSPRARINAQARFGSADDQRHAPTKYNFIVAKRR